MELTIRGVRRELVLRGIDGLREVVYGVQEATPGVKHRARMIPAVHSSRVVRCGPVMLSGACVDSLVEVVEDSELLVLVEADGT